VLSAQDVILALLFALITGAGAYIRMLFAKVAENEERIRVLEKGFAGQKATLELVKKSTHTIENDVKVLLQRTAYAET